MARLVSLRRRQQRPPYSQLALANELRRLGYPVTAMRIARLELSDPHRDPVELVTAIAFVLDIDSDAVFDALLEDARTVEAEVREQLAARGS